MEDFWDTSDPRVGIAGDWHGNFNWLGHALTLCRKAGVKTVFHLGDFGIWPGREGQKWLARTEAWCVTTGITLVVTPGNHEDYSQLDALFAAHPGEPVRLSPHVIILPRGYRWVQAGRSMMSFGGAASIDFAWRVPAKTWWLGEMPKVHEVQSAAAAGPVEVLLTHESPHPTSAVEAIISSPGSWSWEARVYAAKSRELMGRLWKNVTPAIALHGHYHIADKTTLPSGQRVFSLGCDGQAGNLGVLEMEPLGFAWLDGP